MFETSKFVMAILHRKQGLLRDKNISKYVDRHIYFLNLWRREPFEEILTVVLHYLINIAASSAPICAFLEFPLQLSASRDNKSLDMQP